MDPNEGSCFPFIQFPLIQVKFVYQSNVFNYTTLPLNHERIPVRAFSQFLLPIVIIKWEAINRKLLHEEVQTFNLQMIHKIGHVLPT